MHALSWADLAVFAEVQRMRARGRALGADAPWGAYIGEAEVDEILGDLLKIGPLQLDEEVGSAIRDMVDDRRAEVVRARRAEEVAFAKGEVVSDLTRLAAAFELEDIDVDLLLLALAPEVNARYLRLYAYLQDDLSAQHLTPALAFRLLSDDRAERIRLAGRLAPDAPLLRHSLLLLPDAAEHPGRPIQAQPLTVAPRISRRILQGEVWDPDLHPWCRLEPDVERPTRTAVIHAVDGLLQVLAQLDTGPVVRIDARSQRDALEAARHLARAVSSPLMVVDLAAGARLGIAPERVSARLAREARLQSAVVLVLDPPEPTNGADPLAPLLVATQGTSRPLLLHRAPSGTGEPLGDGRRFLALHLSPLTLSERRKAWTELFKGDGLAAEQDLDRAEILARRYRFSHDQIAQVVELARDAALASGRKKPTADDVQAACVGAFLPELGPLAEQLQVRRGWDDLVVPPEARRLLEEMLAQVEQRELVLEALGPDRVRQGERGVKALFTGAPGTGKSLAAEVLAHSLGYPLFRVDLSMVVSKWVGETEKQLNKLFTAAEEAPCVLLFDEADALFGKRSEVKDAQDRFANLEVSYLLQRVEAFDGIAILTSNLKRNIDEAFLRRFTFAVDFPFPEVRERLAIWKRLLPKEYPLAASVDLADVAREFKLAGANIWNVAVAAACMAAASKDGRITRAMLAHTVLREYQKLGRQVTALRPSILAGVEPATDPDGHSPRRKGRAKSAAEARRERVAEPTHKG
jgi:MoxR-like ATPase